MQNDKEKVSNLSKETAHRQQLAAGIERIRSVRKKSRLYFLSVVKSTESLSDVARYAENPLEPCGIEKFQRRCTII